MNFETRSHLVTPSVVKPTDALDRDLSVKEAVMLVLMRIGPRRSASFNQIHRARVALQFKEGATGTNSTSRAIRELLATPLFEAYEILPGPKGGMLSAVLNNTPE